MRTANWVREGAIAHLVDWERTPGGFPGRLTADGVAICARSLNAGATEAPLLTRCKNCIDTAQRWAEQALAPVPALVRETVTVSVTRPAHQPASLQDVLAAAIGRKRSWVDVSFGEMKTEEGTAK